MSSHMVSGSRRFVFGLASFGLIVGGLVVPSARPAFAGPGDLVSGTVIADANGNGAIDSTGQPGTNDVGVAGVKVTLCDTSTSTCWTTTTSTAGAWNFPATGAWAGATGPFTVTIDAAGVNNNVYVTETANDWTAASGATPQTATSAPFPVTSNDLILGPALVKPVWKLDLSLLTDPTGVDGYSVFTGTDPFDTAGTTGPGTDDSKSNDIIRSGDILAMNWSVTAASSGGTLSDQTGPVIFEQTIYLERDAMLTFAQMPNVCKTTGATPPSQVIAQPSGQVVAIATAPPAGTTSLMLTCNMGNAGNAAGAATGFLVIEQLRPLGQSPNGSQIKTSTRVYAAAPNGAAVAIPDPAPVDPGPFTITSVPKYDVQKRGSYGGGWTTATLPGKTAPESVFQLNYELLITVPTKAGVEALKSPITLTDDLWGVFMNNPDKTMGAEMTDLVYYVTYCGQNNNMAPNDAYRSFRPVNSAVASSTGNDPLGLSSIAQSGTCTYARGTDNAAISSGYSAPGPVKLTITGTDTSGQHFPTRTLGSGTDDLAKGPFYVASFQVQIVIPLTEILRAGAVPGNTATGLTVNNQFTGFDPDGFSGTSNYGSGNEPGYCPDRALGVGAPHTICDPITGLTKSNNIAGPNNIVISAAGSWAQYLLDKTAGWAYGYGLLPSMGSTHDGAGQVAPGTTYMAMLNLSDSSGGVVPIDLSQTIGACTIFDNRMAKLAPLSQAQWLNGGAASQNTQKAQLTSTTNPYAAVMVVNGVTITNPPAVEPGLQSNFTFMYGVADLTGDVSNNGTFDAATGRYGGVWTAQRTVNCGDGLSNITWYTDPLLAPGGIDSINAVRFISNPGIPQNTVTATTLSFQIGLQQRETFYAVADPANPMTSAMVDTGTIIPAGTVFAVFGRPLYNRAQKDTAGNAVWWTGRNTATAAGYVPQPENGNSDGDRWTVVRAVASITIDTITMPTPNPGPSDQPTTDGASAVSVAGRADAGNAVVWRVMPVINPAPGMPPGGTVSNVVVTATIPKTATYDPSKTALLTGGTPADSVVTNPDGSVTLSWNLGTWTVGTPIPPRIIYTTTDPMAPSPTSIVVPVTIRSSSITVTNAMGMTNHEPTTNPATWTWPLTSTVTHTVNITQPARIQVKLTTDGTLYLQDTAQGYTATIANFADTISFQMPTIYDRLPVVGDDGSAVAARSPASAFTGTAKLDGEVMATNKNGAPVAGTVYYWTGTYASMPERPEDDTYPMDGSGLWKTIDQLTAAGMTMDDVTGWKFVATYQLAPSTDPNSIINLHFSLLPDGDQAGEVFANRFTAFSSTLMSGGEFQVQASNETVVGVLGFSLGDFIWEDVDYDGVYTEGVDQPADGVVVQVFNADGDLMATTATTAGGRWLVNNLPATDVTGTVASGQYYVVIPASQFATGGPLAGWAASLHNVQPADANVNEDADHSAVDLVPGVPGSGVRSDGLITLSATINATTKVVAAGNEPLGDNVAALVTPQLATDNFTNFTVDLALQGVYGTFQVTKAWTGTVPAWDPASPTYMGPWSCTKGGATVASGTWYIQGTGDATMVSDFGPPNTEIPSGSICSAIEQSPSSVEFPSLAWSWQAPFTTPDVTIATFQTRKVTVTNSAQLATGPFAVVKAWSGPVPSWVASMTFTGTWACQDQAEGVDVSGTWSVMGLGPATMTGLPASGLPIGTLCTASENVDPVTGLPTNNLPSGWLWAPPKVEPAVGATVVEDDTAVVKLTNTVSGYKFSKSASPAAGTVTVGATITYTLLGENTGDEPLIVTVEDDLSAVLNHATLDVAPVAEILGGDGSNVPDDPVLTGTELSWSGTLNPGEKIQITYTVKTKDAGVTITNLATSDATTPDGQHITGQAKVEHKTVLPASGNTGGVVAPHSPPGWLPPLLFLSGLVVMLVRRRYVVG